MNELTKAYKMVEFLVNNDSININQQKVLFLIETNDVFKYQFFLNGIL